MNSQRKHQIIAHPTAIPIKAKCKGIVAAYNHSYAYSDNRVYYWGQKHHNKQQNIHQQSRENEKLVVMQLALNKMASGKVHSFGWSDSDVYCWGSNQYYELGLEEQKQYPVARMHILQKAIQRGYNLQGISCGQHHTLAYFSLKTDQTEQNSVIQQQNNNNALIYEQQDSQNPNAQWQLFGWGQSNSYQLTINTFDIIPYPVISPCTFKQLEQIYSKSDYNIAVCQGKVYSWGCNLFSRLGQLIYSSQLPKVRLPREVVLPQKITKIGIGTYHVVAVSQTGTAYSWGKGNQGQLGTDKLQIEGKPSKVLCDYKIKDASCGQSHTLVLLQDGRLMSCGSNNHGVLGLLGFDVADKKKKVKRLQFVLVGEQMGEVVSISCGNSHNLVLNMRGEVFGWGSNEFYQIMPNLNQDQPRLKQSGYSQQSKYEQSQNSLKQNLEQKLYDWKCRYQAFKQAKQKEQQLFMSQLQQILQQSGRNKSGSIGKWVNK